MAIKFPKKLDAERVNQWGGGGGGDRFPADNLGTAESTGYVNVRV